jgi:DNA-binding transcriptional MerR regulator
MASPTARAPLPPPAPLAPAPDATFSIREAARAAGTTVRSIRYYVERKVVPPPEFKSVHTRYDCAFLVRLRAVTQLRKKNLRIDAIRKQIDAASPDELLRIAGYAMPPPAAAPPPAGPAPSTVLPAGFVGPYRAGTTYPSERWEHLAICPGVMLLVKSEADAEAWRVGREIVALFGKAQTV